MARKLKRAELEKQRLETISEETKSKVNSLQTSMKTLKSTHKTELAATKEEMRLELALANKKSSMMSFTSNQFRQLNQEQDQEQEEVQGGGLANIDEISQGDED